MAAAFVIFTPDIVKSLDFFFAWIRANPIAGYFIYFVVYLVCVPLFFPVFILTLAGALAFKEALGLVSKYSRSLTHFSSQHLLAS